MINENWSRLSIIDSLSQSSWSRIEINWSPETLGAYHLRFRAVLVHQLNKIGLTPHHEKVLHIMFTKLNILIFNSYLNISFKLFYFLN